MVTLTLSKEEISALLGLMDAGVKALGRPAARACAILDEKIHLAVRGAQKAHSKPANGEGREGNGESRATDESGTDTSIALN